MSFLMFYILRLISFLLNAILLIIDLGESVVFLFFKLLGINNNQRIIAQHGVAEEDSAHQILYRLRIQRKSLSKEEKFHLINQIVEEKNHADLFKKELDSNGRQEFEKKLTSRCFKNACDSYFIKVGEQAAIRKYKIMLSFHFMNELENIYKSILVDEEGHEEWIEVREETIKAYVRAQLKYTEVLLNKYVRKILNFIFLLIAVPFYYFIFFPVAKITLWLASERSK